MTNTASYKDVTPTGRDVLSASGGAERAVAQQFAERSQLDNARERLGWVRLTWLSWASAR